MARFVKAFIFLLSFTFNLYPQNQNIRFEHLSVDDGLSNNIIWSIIQDSRGFMWFGTEDGLNKYDGYTFTIYRHDPDDSLSISGNYIRSMYESHYGGNHVLWIGTINGLNRLDLETEKFTHYPISDEQTGLSNDYITSIYEDNSGELWIGAISGMKRFNRRTGKFIQYQYNPGHPTNLSHNNCIVTQSSASKPTILWVGTWQGLKKFDCKSEKFIDYKHDYDRMSTLYINWIYPDTTGNLWLSSHNAGLKKYNIETGKYTSYEYDPDNPNSISAYMLGSLVEDNVRDNNVLWIGTYNGLNKFDIKTEKFTHYKHNPGDPQSLCNDRIIRVFKDKTGIIWIGTQGGGLSKFDPRQQKFEDFKQEIGNPHGLSDNSILAITESKYDGPNIFWIGTINGGLNKYYRNTGRFIHYRHDPHDVNSISNDFVITLFESNYQGRNELWVGTLYGLNKFDLKTNKITRYFHAPNDPHSISDNLIRSICEDKSGTLWIGTRNGGINRFDRASGKFDKHKYNLWEAIDIIEDNTGAIWAGTDLGLFHYNHSTDDFIQYIQDPDDPDNISQNKVLSLYEDKSAQLWIGTDDGFIFLNRGPNKLIRYTTKDGLPNNVINGILEDDHGYLWLSTNQGLSRFDPLQKTFKNYDMYDGLQSNQFLIGSACLSQKGEMFFGGVNGFNVFHPDSIRDNSYMPDIYLTDFQIFNKKVKVKTSTFQDGDDHYYLQKHISNISEITLSHKENVFSFEFAALDYHSPQKNQYVYKMEGIDPDWVSTNASRRFATYTNLDPGEYVFKIKASNNDGIWNEEGTSVKVIIFPPWWKTRLAYALYIFLFGLVVYSVWRVQTNRMKMKQQMEQEHFEAEKLREVDKLKSRFFANISHEFRTPLTLIKGPLQQLISGEFKGNIKEQYHTMLRNSDRLLRLINQILDLSRVEAGEIQLKVAETEIIQYIRGLVLSFSSLAERKNVTLEFTSSENKLKGYIDRDKLEKIINNLLSNAFKYTPEGGDVLVKINIPLPSASLDRGEENWSPLGKGDLGGCIELAITNTGPLIPPDQIEKIFDRFYQADTTYKKDGEGSGIGLALTKELVELHHGNIDVKCEKETENSAPNIGEMYTTTFTILLPIDKERFTADEIVEESTSRIPHPKSQISHPESRIPDPESRIPHRGSSILIVEDNPDVTSYISSFLNSDYQIISAENGLTGLEMTLDKYPDLVISDVMMPEMDGFELCQKIKTDQRVSHIPVILLTAKADLDSKIEGLEYGADDYVSKPFDSKELQARVKNLIEQRRLLKTRFSTQIDLHALDVVSTSQDKSLTDQIMNSIYEHISDSNFNLDKLAGEIGMSRTTLHRKTTGLFGQSPGDFVRIIRLKHGANLLKNNKGNISEIAYSVGFSNPANFSTSFRRQFGISPKEYARTFNQD